MASSRRFPGLLLPPLIGLAIFFAFTGGRIVDPTHLDWIMATGGDPIQHYIGWSFFRHSDFLQFPLGLNMRYGEAIGSSIVFSDSIPLLALPFKYLGPLLPSPFQYFGLWTAACFALQAWFAWRILALYSRNVAVLAIGSALLTLSPPMLWRLLGHEALVGHWLVLAALYLYLRGSATRLQWLFVLGIAALVHPYLLAMALGIWFAERVRAYRDGRLHAPSAAVEGLLVFVCLALVMLSAGYFQLSGTGSEGYGYYRFNITSPIHPLDIWSIWRKTPYVGGDYEGFSYPGAGMFLLTLIVLLLVLQRVGVRREKLDLNWRQTAPLIAVCAVFYFYALSNHVALGSHELLQYDVPAPFQKFVSTFRSTGRFIWPVFYAFEILLLVLLIRLLRGRMLVATLTVVLLFQATDLVEASRFFRARWSQQWQSPLQSAFWPGVPRQYQRIAFVFPLDGGEQYAPIAFMAANARMTINGGYFARVDFDKLHAVQDQLTREIATGDYRADTLYVFFKDDQWEKARAGFRGDGFLGYVDGFRVVAPQWRGCTDTCAYRNKLARLDFTGESGGNPYVGAGWSDPAPGGRWTDGHSADVSIPLDEPAQGPLVLRMELLPYIKPGHTQQRIIVRINGTDAAQWRFTSERPEVRQVPIGAGQLGTDRSRIRVELALPDAIAPKTLGISDDTRLLGLNVRSIEVYGR